MLKEEKEDYLAAIGWPQYQAALTRAIDARYAYNAASERAIPAAEAAAMHAADKALDAARTQYPLAAAYSRGELQFPFSISKE